MPKGTPFYGITFNALWPNTDKDNTDRYFVHKCLLINFAAYEATIDTKIKKNQVWSI